RSQKHCLNGVLMSSATIDRKPNVGAEAKSRSPQAEPRVVEDSFRIEPGYEEQAAHRRFAGAGWKNPPKTMYRDESDFPIEKALGWKRFRCRGIDAIDQNGFRVRETAWPAHYIIAPDKDSAE